MTELADRAVGHDEAGQREDVRICAEFARVEARLIAEFGGNPAADAMVRAQVVAVQEYFAAAPIRRYLPILVERAVRSQLTAR
ncbi:hypothetical protein QRX50_36265 [Amycolatopsis carbonis]|uniref:Uncharacterized protein n=1 Tax=Amycolatopsis carbonis TaxID=715471 RepID=A0A9Y2IBH1_9PSEU|nr:hypothetical protein [Amycolatopsis sp. 2-15]WIX76844.1 hypothetical protein QRX50_36265 [Amycolatopsis sp. 2-15]